MGYVSAQETSSPGPVYIVQEGDSLWEIADRFHVSPEALARANGIVNFNQITHRPHWLFQGWKAFKEFSHLNYSIW